MYDIGTYVVVHTVTKRSRVSAGVGKDRIKWKDAELKTPVLGRVVGLCRRMDGTLECPLNYEEQTYMVDMTPNEFYLVRLGWLNKPIYVRAENMRLAKIEEIKDLPKLHMVQTCWNSQSREDMCKEMATWPRDKNGRWT